jgi:hypothetical protein
MHRCKAQVSRGESSVEQRALRSDGIVWRKGRRLEAAQSTEDIQRSTMTKRRSRRMNRCRPSNALDEHRHDHGDDNDGAQAMAAQNNNKHRQYVSFSRKIGRFTTSQPIELTQMRLDADSKQTTNDDRQEATEAR